MERHSAPRRRAKTRRPEQELQRQIVKALKALLTPATFFYAVPNGGYRRKIEAAILVGQGVRAGVPDLMFIHCGKSYGLELKAREGKPTAIQVQVHNEMYRAGAAVAIVRSLDEALNALRGFGIELRTDFPKRPALKVAA